MENWPIPNLDLIDISYDRDRPEKWHPGDEREEANNSLLSGVDLPRGWGKAWPDLPRPDRDIEISGIRLSEAVEPVCKGGYLGYYMPWHMIALSFRNELGHLPSNGDVLKAYNDNLPIGNRHGIHVCCDQIDRYTASFDTTFLEGNELTDYLNYCRHLTLIWVISHEWGHYRSEALSFQLQNIFSSVAGRRSSPLLPSYLSYWIDKKMYPNENFEEVFAEWSSLKMGIFNARMPTPAFITHPSGLALDTVKYMLTVAMISPGRPRPYRDIRYWVDMQGLSDLKYLGRMISAPKILNRSVNKHTKLKGIRSMKKGKMVDLLMHNQLQFSAIKNSAQLVRSAPNSYPYHPDSLFYHLADDEFFSIGNSTGHSKRYIRIDHGYFTGTAIRNSSCFSNLEPFLTSAKLSGNIPIPVFPEVLGLDPVYFHQ